MIKKELTKAEFEEMKQGMASEFGRLKREVGSGGDRQAPPTPVVAFVPSYRIDTEHFTGQAGSKDGNLYFHFWGTHAAPLPDGFKDKLGDAFTACFPYSRCEWDWVPEGQHPDTLELEEEKLLPHHRGSWVVRVPGIGTHLFVDTLVMKLFEGLAHSLRPSNA